jgi:hypothetical protein
MCWLNWNSNCLVFYQYQISVYFQLEALHGYSLFHHKIMQLFTVISKVATFDILKVADLT